LKAGTTIDRLGAIRHGRPEGKRAQAVAVAGERELCARPLYLVARRVNFGDDPSSDLSREDRIPGAFRGAKCPIMVIMFNPVKVWRF
jgi:hypothetical protein